MSRKENDGDANKKKKMRKKIIDIYL